MKVDDRHSDGHTPLQRACWGRDARHADTAKVFLEGGASLEGIAEGSNPMTVKIVKEWKKKRSEL